MDSNGFKVFHKDSITGLLYSELIGEKKEETWVGIEEESVGKC